MKDDRQYNFTASSKIIFRTPEARRHAKDHGVKIKMKTSGPLINRYESIQNSQSLTPYEKATLTSKLKLQPRDIRPPLYSYDYDNLDGKKINRVTSNGIYPTVKLITRERPTGRVQEFSDALSDKNSVIVGDLNLTPARMNDVVNTISGKLNIGLKKNLIIVGNLLKGSFMARPTYFSLILEFMSKIPTDRIYLLLGDSDIFEVTDYISFGFWFVTDRAEKTFNGKKLIYSYYSTPTGPNEINIHAGNPVRYVSSVNHFNVSMADTMQAYTLDEIYKKVMAGGDS